MKRAKTNDWWHEMSPAAKESYLKKHPNSKLPKPMPKDAKRQDKVKSKGPMKLHKPAKTVGVYQSRKSQKGK